MLSPKPEDRIGSRIAGKYLLEELLGKGGMGLVYGGKHSWTGHEVAVKVLLPHLTQEPTVVERFLREARAAAQIKDRHVVRVLDMGQEEDEVYLVLERLHGETLKARLRRGPLSLAEGFGVLQPIMQALAKAHSLGILHRDLKPDNIYLAEEDGEIIPKLLDFGVAKILEEGRQGSTATGALMGTPWYMSPEQAKGSRELSPALDVWGIAVLYFVTVSGKLPYTARSPAQVLYLLSSRDTEMLPLAKVRPETPEPVSEVIARCLRRQPSERPSMQELIDSLGEALLSAATPAGAHTLRSPAPSDEQLLRLLEKSTDQEPSAALPGSTSELTTSPKLTRGKRSALDTAEDDPDSLSYEQTVESDPLLSAEELREGAISEELPPRSSPPARYSPASHSPGPTRPAGRAAPRPAPPHAPPPRSATDDFPLYSSTYAAKTDVSEDLYIQTESISVEGELPLGATEIDEDAFGEEEDPPTLISRPGGRAGPALPRISEAPRAAPRTELLESAPRPKIPAPPEEPEEPKGGGGMLLLLIAIALLLLSAGGYYLLTRGG